MEGLVNSIVGLSGSPSDLAQLHTHLKGASATITAATAASLAPVLAQLDPTQHSLGVLFLLEHLAKTANLGDAAFIDHVSRFLQLATASQIRMAPEMFATVCRKLKDHVIAARCPRRGILPLRSAIKLLQPTPEHLTPVHPDFLQLCIMSKVYNAAAEAVEGDLYEVDPSRTGVTITDLFLYCYLGGMICTGRKQHARALELFLQALTAPAMVGNAIVVACYKKYVLVSLMHTGALPPLPKFTPTRVRQAVDSEARAYNDLASAFQSHNADKLRRVMEQHTQLFSQDGNLGLVKQVAASLTMRNIQRLTQTYLTLPLTDIAHNVGLPSAADAEVHVLRMVGSGEIHARICEQPAPAAAPGGPAAAGGSGVVRFLEDPERYDNAGVAHRIDDHIKRCTALTSRLQAVHDAVTLDRSYLTKVTAKERSRYGMGGEAQGGSDEFAGALFQPQGPLA